MKGLLLKDFYLLKKYVKALLILFLVWLVGAIFTDTLFLTLYLCLFSGLIPVSLLAADEQSRWMQYSGTLPYTKAQLVSSKYCIVLLLQLAMALTVFAAQAIIIAVKGTWSLQELLAHLPLLFVVPIAIASIVMPFAFRFGLEKGRIVVALCTGLAFLLLFFVVSYFAKRSFVGTLNTTTIAIVALAGILLYALSWYLSIVFFQKRELA